MGKIFIHCDDYGLSINSSKIICNCIDNNKINSISIIPNMSSFKNTIDLLKKYQNIKKTLHLNLLEGRCLSDINDVKDLVDSNGLFKLSWIKLFFYSFNFFKYKKIKNELKIEIKNQILKILPYLEELRIDSHQHTHVIPIVSSALFEVIEENKFNLKYIRIPREPNIPFVKDFFKLRPYKLKYIFSHSILNILSLNLKRKVEKYNIEYSYLFGTILSGNMSLKAFNILKKYIKKYSFKYNYEILFHPGTLLKNEINSEFNKIDFIKFYLSKNRKKEFKAINNVNLN